MAPSTAYDAKGLLKAAIRDPNPVIYFEHKFLYRRIKDILPIEDFIVPIGEAEIKRTGRDLSIITYGRYGPCGIGSRWNIDQEGTSTWKWWTFER
ncbi:MAG: hypothetical protein R3B95_06860 [Nitrospirales bacterium]